MDLLKQQNDLQTQARNVLLTTRLLNNLKEFTSVDIYNAVFENKVTDEKQFLDYLKKKGIYLE